MVLFFSVNNSSSLTHFLQTQKIKRNAKANTHPNNLDIWLRKALEYKDRKSLTTLFENIIQDFSHGIL